VEPDEGGLNVRTDPAASGAIRELRTEVEHLYDFLSRNVYEAARQIGTLGRVLAEEGSSSLPREAKEDATQLRREAERLISYLREFSEVTRAMRVQSVSQGSSLLKALERLGTMRFGLPPNVSFSGDLGYETAVPREILELMIRAVAVFVYERGDKNVPRDVRLSVHTEPNGILLEAALGSLPLGREQLSRAFLPGAEVSKDGRILPSLAVVAAVARRYDGRAWIARSTASEVVLHVSMRP
jgi:hypothetical protein